jgi:hypothetical protein
MYKDKKSPRMEGFFNFFVANNYSATAVVSIAAAVVSGVVAAAVSTICVSGSVAAAVSTAAVESTAPVSPPFFSQAAKVKAAATNNNANNFLMVIKI